MSVIKLTAANFEQEVMKSEKPVLIDFYADWCGPCQMQTPILERVADALVNEAVIAKLNVDESQDIAIEYGVASIPTMIIFKDGKEVDRIVGLTPEDKIIERIKAV